MKEVTARTLVVCILCLLFAATASAVSVDPPHGNYGCTVCHTGHVTLGSSGFNNICLSCHRPGVPSAGRRPFTPADASDPFVRYTSGGRIKLQTSHRWDGTDTVPAAGAEPPLFSGLTSVRSKTGGELACVRCHNQHSNAYPPYLRMPNDQDQLCFDCHRSRNIRDHLSGTHPVNFVLNGADSKAVLEPAKYHNPPVNAAPGNASSDLGASLKNGRVVCSTCHRVHYADSSSTTFDSYSSYYHLKDGDGNILRTDRRGAAVASGAADRTNICTNCHAGKKNHNYRGQDVQCTDCHGAHVDPGDGSLPNSFLIKRLMSFSSAQGAVRKRPVFTRATSALSTNFKDQAGTGVCQACHEVPEGVSPLHSLPEARARDCHDCHYHESPLGSFSGGCTLCHGYPITSTAIGGPSGLATPATGVLGPAPASAGAHGTHVTAKAIQCFACHSGYTQNPMGNGVIEVGFGVTPQTWSGFVGSVTTGTINANSTLNPGYSWRAAAGTTLNLAPGQQVSCNVYCHGATLTGGSNNAPVWTGTSQAVCGSCHGATAAAPPTAGSHLRHAGSGASGLALSCANCHGNVGAVKHVNGTVLWDVTRYPGATYRGAASGATGTPAPSASYGQCANLYCHSDVQGAGGTGAPTYATPTWGGAPLSCEGCHRFDMTQPGAPGSHRKHFTSTIWTQTPTCGSCHAGAGGGTAKHADGSIDVAFAAGSYSQSPNPPGNGYGSCSNVSCHAGKSVAWGSALAADCSGCHGNDAASAAPIATGAHRAHMNNYSTLGRGNNLSCNTCHAATVGGNRAIASPARHIDGFATYSGARAGRLANAASGRCSANYCHSDGRPTPGFRTLSSASWFSGTRLDCSGCHGAATLADGSAAAFTSVAGEPNYANGGVGSGRANTHKIHVGDAGATSSTGCATCHLTTVDRQIAGKLRDFSTAHLDGARTVRFSRLDGVQGRYSSTTQQCLNTYCHSSGNPAWGGAPLTCNDCHKGGDGLPAGHALHWQGSAVATSYVATPGNQGNAATYQFSCSSCHGTPGLHARGPVSAVQTAEVFFGFTSAGRTGSYAPGTNSFADGSFTYTNGTCSATYCHSDGNGGGPANTSFTWSSPSGTLGCSGCHPFAAIATAGHQTHVQGYGYGCVRCHAATTDGSAVIDKSRHVNKVKDVAWDALNAGGASYAGSCSAIYCHSSGTSFTAPYGAPRVVPTWRGSLPADCSGCHGGLATGPDYPNGSPKANSHATHVAVNRQGCNLCHQSVTADGQHVTTPANHAGKSYQLSAGGGASFTVAVPGTPGTPTQCSDISCHGGTGHNATWGASLACQDCHLSANADLDVFALPFTIASPLGNLNQTEWTTTGHGRTAGTYRSGNAAAGFGGAAACLYCHDAGTGHNVAANPFRLLNYSSAAWGHNQTCQNCHAAGSAGVSAGGTIISSTLKITATHFGTSHGAANNAGQFCWDCHDPHGDGNDYMIQAQVALASDRVSGAPGATTPVSFVLAQPGTLAWGDFVKPSPSFDGVCQVCHRSTGANAVAHFPAGGFDASHNPGSSCIGCHSHNGPTPQRAFEPSGNCDLCHGYPPVPAGFTGTSGRWSSARLENYPGGGGAHAVAKHVAPKARPSEGFANCSRCHNVLDHRVSPVTFLPSTNIRVSVDPRFGFEFGKQARYSSNRLDGASHVTGACSNINCHFGASPKWDPQH